MKIEKGYAHISARYEAPDFDLFDTTKGALQLPKILLARLAPFGVTVHTMKWESGDAIGGTALYTPASDYAVAVRIGVERVAVECFHLDRVALSVVTRIAAETLGALVDAKGSNPAAQYVADLRIHGRPELDVRAFLAALVNLPPRALRGPLQGRGVSYFMGENEDQTFSGVTLEASGEIEGGLFMRKSTTWKAQRFELRFLPDLIENDLSETFVTLGLTSAGDLAKSS